jgi:hypothetical protein
MAPALPFIMMGLAAVSTATSIYSMTQTPEVPKAPKDTSAQESQEAAYAEAERLRKRHGASSTILTGPLGITQAAQTSKTTLG